jgi:hypothetical protein
MIQIGIYPTGEKPNQHIVRVAPRVSCMTTVREVPTRSKSDPAPGMKSWLPVIVWPSRHPGLPHSPSTKPPRSKEVRFDKVVTKLLGLSGPIKLDIRSLQLKSCPPGPK